MKKMTYFMLLLVCFYLGCMQDTKKQPVDFVDPFICTEGDHGHWHPSALVPFGQIKLGPDTYPSSLTGDGDWAHSGYNYADNEIRGFSHFHRGSSGGGSVSDRAGNFSFFPFVESIEDISLDNPVIGIDKLTQKAQAGYYSVKLNNDILVELTAMAHVGFHRYTFPANKPQRIYLNPGNWSRYSTLSVKKKSNTELFALLRRGNIHYNLVIQFNRNITHFKVIEDNKVTDKEKLEKRGGVILEFDSNDNKPLLAKVGVSLISEEAATHNMTSEFSGWDFEACRTQARDIWNDQLSAIKVEGESEYKTIFYTALYHTCFLPVTITDVDGTYPGMDRKNHVAKHYTNLGNYAFWDSFRTKYPLYSLAFPRDYHNIVHSLYNTYTQMDNWAPYPNATHKPHGPDNCFPVRGKDGYHPYTSCRHEHMLMVMTDAYYKGLFKDVSIDSVYPYLRAEALVQMPAKYDAIGYIPARPDQTGEYSWDNWCVAQVAKTLNNPKDYDYFSKRAQYWKNTWDPSIKFNRARAANGQWLDFPDDPTTNREKYTYEGSKWHWRWNTIHDVEAMIPLFGGRDGFIKELEHFFDNDLYTAGNQIDLHVPFLFNYAGAPWLTQKWVRKILTEPMVQKYGTHGFFEKPIYDRIYKTTPDGYLEEMDCDYGCMAAWYVLSSMGLYQVCPGQPIYQITAPIFERVELNLDSDFYPGPKVIFEAPNVSSENIYIQSITRYDANGKLVGEWTKPGITHDELVKGGRFVFEMGDSPNKNWGIEKN